MFPTGRTQRSGWGKAAWQESMDARESGHHCLTGARHIRAPGSLTELPEVRSACPTAVLDQAIGVESVHREPGLPNWRPRWGSGGPQLTVPCPVRKQIPIPLIRPWGYSSAAVS